MWRSSSPPRAPTRTPTDCWRRAAGAARASLADYKAPDRVVVLDRLPLTSMMKVDKRALADRGRPRHERSTDAMTGTSTPAQGGVTDDPIRIGTILYTLVEPHRGHEVAYNRWYERDHFYAGCQIGAYNFAGARFVATAPLKELRYPSGEGALVSDPSVGSYLGVYYVLDRHHDEWNRWAVDQVNALHAAGRMFEHRDHVHTGLYRFQWEQGRDADGVPAELTLDHRFPGMVSVHLQPAEGTSGADLSDLVRGSTSPACSRTRPWPSCSDSARCHCWPMRRVTSPGTPAADDRSSCSVSSTRSPAAFGRVFAPLGAAVEEAGLGRVQWASAFVATVPGTDTYTDRLWADQ